MRIKKRKRRGNERERGRKKHTRRLALAASVPGPGAVACAVRVLRAAVLALHRAHARPIVAVALSEPGGAGAPVAERLARGPVVVRVAALALRPAAAGSAVGRARLAEGGAARGLEVAGVAGAGAVGVGAGVGAALRALRGGAARLAAGAADCARKKTNQKGK